MAINSTLPQPMRSKARRVELELEEINRRIAKDPGLDPKIRSELEKSREKLETRKAKLEGSKNFVRGVSDQLNQWFWICLVAGSGIILGILAWRTWWYPGQGWTWLFKAIDKVSKPSQGLFGEVQISAILAPVVSVAIAVERMIESGFDLFERSVRKVSDIVRTSIKEADDWIEKELHSAHDAVEAIANQILGETDDQIKDQLLTQLHEAERRLLEAEERLLGWVNAPEYVGKKRALSIVLGMFVGLGVVIWGDIGVFDTIGIGAPRIVDLLFTGLLVGAGPGPMHSLVGMLEGVKDSLQGLGEMFRGKSVRQMMDELSKEFESRSKQTVDDLSKKLLEELKAGQP